MQEFKNITCITGDSLAKLISFKQNEDFSCRSSAYVKDYPYDRKE